MNKSLPYLFWICISRKYAKFSGRAQRREFWGYMLFSFFFIQILEALDLSLFSLPNGIKITPEFILQLYLVIPFISVSVRRFHDTGRGALVPILFGLFFNAPLLLNALLTFNVSTTLYPITDFAYSGMLKVLFWTLVLAIVLLGLYYIVIVLQDSENGSNQYGHNPESPLPENEIDEIGKE